MTKGRLKRAVQFWVLTGVLLLTASCARQGLLFTNVTEPFTLDFNNTPLGTRTCVVKNYRLKEPLTRLNVSAEWSRGEIAAAARRAGISRIYYVDVHTFSVLLGIYRRKELIAYGD